MLTYDIINSGPKNRFMANGRIVSNSGRIINPQNFPRPDMPTDEIDFGIRAFKADCADLFFPNVMRVASNALRGVITAAPGKKLVIADLSNIEGRFAAWLANETWKLKAFIDYDAGVGPDLYVLAYANMFRVTVESILADKKAGGNQRLTGKTSELALQFQGGCGAFSTFAISMGIDLQKLADISRDIIPPDVWEEAMGFWGWAIKEKRTLGLERDIFVTCDSLKRLWRRAHPNIVALWAELEDAARNAIESKDRVYTARKLKLFRSGNWLRIELPSTRCLSYPAPRVDDKGQITFMGVDQYSRQWRRIKTFAGKLFNNSVQGGSRDVFWQGIVNADEAGYDNVLRVHDEQITEVPDTNEFTVDGLCKLMTTNISWAKGLPLSAGGFESYRYRKDD